MTFYQQVCQQKDPPKKVNLSKQLFRKKRIKGVRRRRSKPVSSPWQDEAEAEFRRVFLGRKLINLFGVAFVFVLSSVF